MAFGQKVIYLLISLGVAQGYDEKRPSAKPRNRLLLQMAEVLRYFQFE